MRKMKVLLALLLLYIITPNTSYAVNSHYNEFGASHSIEFVSDLPEVKKWIELEGKTEVALNKNWTISFNKEFEPNKVIAAVIVKDEALVPVTVEYPKSNQLQITPATDYEANSEYELRIYLQNGKSYKMHFTTESILIPLHFDETFQGNLITNTQVDYYQLSIDKEKDVLIRMTIDDADGYGEFTLTDVEGNIIFSDGFEEIYKYHTTLKQGEYIISIKSDWMPVNEYTISVTEPYLTESEQVRLQQLKAAWAQWKPTYSGPMSIGVSLKEPYDHGMIHPKAAEDGLNMTKMARFIAGVHTNIRLNDEFSERIQAGSLLLYLNQEINHYPAKPANLSQQLYDLGYLGTSKSNLWKISDSLSIPYTVQGYLIDPGYNNSLAVGHRRWVLSPRLGEIGFGYVGGYTGMHVVGGQIAAHSYGEILWPTATVMPLEFFRDEMVWSISLDPEKYAVTDVNEITVEFTLNGEKQTIQTGGDNHLVLSRESYGHQSQVLIFRPENLPPLFYGDRVQVNVTGIKTADLKPTQFSYETVFTTLEEN